MNMNVKTYRRISKTYEPPRPVVVNAVRAFVVGGLICVVGQGVLNLFLAMGMSAKEASSPTAVVMILLASIATAFGVYDRLGKFAGMGSALPITGFANSIVAPAMEFKREGTIYGVGARMFIVAGPILVYGMVTSFFVGLIYWILGLR